MNKDYETRWKQQNQDAKLLFYGSALIIGLSLTGYYLEKYQPQIKKVQNIILGELEQIINKR